MIFIYFSEKTDTTDRNAKIKFVEELSLNAWPSHKIEIYDGWLIRFSHNYTYRTNSVEQIGPSLIPIEEKIAYCESIYRGFKTPCSFKINPLLDPSFDALLQKKGYSIRHVTEVLLLDMKEFHPYPSLYRDYDPLHTEYQTPTAVYFPDNVIVRLQEQITDEWIMGLFRLNGTVDPTLRRIVPSMYHAIPKRTITARIEDNGRIVATGLCILDRDYAGIYAIYVDPYYRRKHYAHCICTALLEEAKKQTASRAYLQVVQGNFAAKSLYMQLGFRDFFSYWFRSKPV